MKEECELRQPCPLEVDQSNYLSRKIDSRDDVPLNGDNLLLEAHSDVKMVEQDEKGIVLMKLKELAFSCGRQDIPLTDYVDEPAITSGMCPGNGGSICEMMSSDEKNEENSCSSSYCQSIIAKLIQGVEELKKIQTEQNLKMRYLEQKLGFSFAAAEIDGVLYPIGGFDGKDYLNSAENFDYRIRYCEQIASMNSKRTCHSLVVLNGKLYALGAYDGSKMVSSIEIYDSRMDSWMRADPMKQTRGYSAAAILKESI